MEKLKSFWKTHFSKARIAKGMKGAISLTLCLLMTPFLSIALGLVEYARYQEVLQTVDELAELTGISALSDYDPYLHQRFGFLASTQEGAWEVSAPELLESNSEILGRQLVINSAVVNGKHALNSTDVLYRQVVDVAELTGTTAVLMNDLNLDVLLDSLSGLSGFNSMKNTVTGLTELTDSVTKAIEALEAVKTAINDLKSTYDTITGGENVFGSAKHFAKKVTDLYTKIAENGIALPSSASAEDIEQALQTFVDDGYMTVLEDAYKSGDAFKKNLTSIESKIGTIEAKIGEFKTAVENAEKASKKLSTSNAADKDGSVSEAAKKSVNDVLVELKDSALKTLEDFKNNALAAGKKAVKDVASGILESSGLTKMATRYDNLVSGDYFKTPLSDGTKEDLTDLFKTVWSVYKSQSGKPLGDYFKSKLVPDLSKIKISNILDIIDKAISAGGSTIQDEKDKGISNILTKLVETVKKLFNMNFFSDGDLNAVVTLASEEKSATGYTKFLTSISDLFTAIDTFKKATGKGGLKGIIEMLKALGAMLKAIGNLMASVINIIGDKINAVISLVGDMVSPSSALYERLLISGYMRHNLPCRTDAGDIKIKSYTVTHEKWVDVQKTRRVSYWDCSPACTVTSWFGSHSWWCEKKYKNETYTVQELRTVTETVNERFVTLNGTGLTGFAYNDVARSPITFDSYAGVLGFTGLASTINALKSGKPNSKTFAGAELEYICAGTKSETANQMFVFFDLYFLRMVLDLPSIFGDAQVSTLAASTTVAAWVVYILYILVEPFLDTILLVNGGTVPFIRKNCWMTATQIANYIGRLTPLVTSVSEVENAMKGFGDKYASGSSTKGESSLSGGSLGQNMLEVDYQTHVFLILLIFVKPSTQVSRLKNLIIMEGKVKYGDSFSLAKSYTVVETSGEVSFRPFFQIGDSNKMFTKKFTQSLSY